MKYEIVLRNPILSKITSPQRPTSKMNAPRAEMELLKEAIEKKEEDLKCPICLETAKPPIFMCPDSHIICSECAPKVQTCPECRVRLPNPPKR